MQLVYFCHVSTSQDTVRAFFKDPQNLLKITPLGFLMSLSPREELRDGFRIKLKFLNFVLLMESLIREVDAYGFVDVAVKKPPLIKYWEHRHIIVPRGNSTLIEDRLTVEASIPNALMKLMLNFIFSYRCKRIKELLA